MTDKIDFQLLSFGMRRIGWIRFWVQSILGVVVTAVLFFSNVVSNNSEGQLSLTPGLSLTTISLILLFLSLFIVPKTLDPARSSLRTSNIDYFPSLIKSKKFIYYLSRNYYVKIISPNIKNIKIKESRFSYEGYKETNVFLKTFYIICSFLKLRPLQLGYFYNIDGKSYLYLYLNGKHKLNTGIVQK